MKKLLTILGGAVLSMAMLVFSLASPAQALTPNWNLTGDYMMNMEYQGTTYTHNLSLNQNSAGTLTGTGGYPSTGTHVYEWSLISGSVADNSVEFTANYTMGADALTPLTVLNATGTVDVNGVVSGTWSDNYQGGSRSGTFTLSGSAAVPVTHTISASAGANGTISPTGSVSVNNNTDKTFTITANAGYHVSDVLVDNVSVGAVSTYTFNDVTGNHTISAAFAVNPVTTYTITASAGANGSISPSGSVVVNSSANQTFNVSANTGFQIDQVLVDGVSVGAVSTYTFNNVSATHTISVSFKADEVTNPNPNDKDACKDGKWKTLTNPSFRNQGQCVSFMNHKIHAQASIKIGNDE